MITTLPATLLSCSLVFMLWFLIWLPMVALLEYAAHRWIMHRANRWLDPKLGQLKAHGSHHQGSNDSELVDMPLLNCLLLSSPAFLALGVYCIAVGPISSVVIPAAALLTWCGIYTYLWTRIHRAIHGVERNWVVRLGPVFRFLRRHHLTHHHHATVNYGTVFPWMDYVFFTWFDHRKARRRGTAADRQNSCEIPSTNRSALLWLANEGEQSNHGCSEQERSRRSTTQRTN